VARLTQRLAGGISTGFVAALAALVLIALLYTVSTREPKEPRGYAELTMSQDGCTVDSGAQLHARQCEVVSAGVYRVSFSKSLAGSTVLASRGSCCPGPIAASIEAPDAVLVVIPARVRGPVRGSILVP
jgi:hypothetical protein